MKEKTNAGILIGAVVIGLVIGYVFGNTTNQQKNENTIAHRMPDGSMMMNDHAHSGMEDAMHDMTSALSGKTGDAFDQEFLAQMIVHHEGAVEMAEMVLQQSTKPELRALAQEIISAQTKEINMMRAWQKSWVVPGVAVPQGGAPTSPVSSEPSHGGDTVMCTMDAKQCPDGSYVGRQGPNCEFAKCPGQ